MKVITKYQTPLLRGLYMATTLKTF